MAQGTRMYGGNSAAPLFHRTFTGALPLTLALDAVHQAKNDNAGFHMFHRLEKEGVAVPFLKTASCAKGRRGEYAETYDRGLDAPRKGLGAQAAEDYLVYGVLPTGRTATHSLEDYLSNPKMGTGRPAEYRCRAYRHSDSIKSEGPEGWAAEMDYIRESYGKDDGRKWYHFILSPDPEDRVAPEEVADMAAEWARKAYPGTMWTVIVHDDNTNHIPHAHIVVNSVYPDSGRKVHRSNGKIDAEWNIAQKIGFDHGLSVLPMAEEYKQNRRLDQEQERQQETKETFAERGMRNDGRWSWKAEIKEAIEMSVKASVSWDSFIDNMAAIGFTVTEGRRGVCFQHPLSGGHDLRVLGSTLGSKWSKDALLDRMGFEFSSAASGTGAAFSKPSEKYSNGPIPDRLLKNAGVRKPRKAIYKDLFMTMSARRRSCAAKGNIYVMWEALSTVKREKIRSMSQLEEMADKAERDLVDLAERVEVYNRGYDRAMALYDLVGETEELAKKLEEPVKGFLSMQARKERRALEAKVAENRAKIAADLARAEGWLEENGYGKLNDREKAVTLAYSFSDLFASAEKDLNRLRIRVKDLNVAREAAKRTMPKKADFSKLGTAPKHGKRVRSEQVQRILDLARRQREAQRGTMQADDSFVMEQDVRRRRIEFLEETRRDKAQAQTSQQRPTPMQTPNVRISSDYSVKR